eukprot:TRINITY_DN1969_c1_g1_i2.p2 TRINITY_DN1969_c1_g1~~TRINITY_DN1969_c1_g1_i2.p2  ORF type:complete len:421 (-),score=35.97 TRINITY_DN1969_c1_g1_i2:1580-2842(-)
MNSLSLSILTAIFIVSTVAFAEPQDKVMENEDWDSGIIDLYNTSDSSPTDDMFYILIRCRNKTISNPPLLLWIQGGPGCSPTLGLYMENGPYIFGVNGSYFRNPNAWNEVADTLFIDQPPGVGFSQVKSKDHLCANLTCVGKNMYMFLLKFVQVYPEYQGRPIYVTGQSYAGQYIPGIVGYLARAKNPLVNIKGAAIGNGIINLGLQVGTYPMFGYENGLISFTTFLRMQVDSWLCQSALLLQVKPLFNFCNQAYLQIRYGLPNANDIRKKRGNPQPRYIGKYLSDINIRKQFGTTREYAMCNVELNATLYHMYYEYTLDDLIDALENGVDVLLYYGDKDAVCNWRGGENVAYYTPWSGRDNYRKAKYEEWYFNGISRGKMKRYKNLAFLKIYDSGHYVPTDQPEFALHMIEKFMHHWNS